MEILPTYTKLLIIGFSLLLCIQSVSGQNISDELFLEDSRYTDSLKKRVLDKFDRDNGKTITQLQLETASVQEDTPIKVRLPAKGKKRVLSPEKLYEKNKRAVVIVGRMSHNINSRKPAYVGLYASAFILSEDGLCITNRHVLTDVINASADSTAQKNGDRNTFFIETYDGEIYLIDKILAYSTANDVCMFTLKGLDKKLPYIPLGDAPSPASRVSVIAHPDNNYFYYSEGVVARNSAVSLQSTKKKQWCMTITAEYAVGSSGGPIMDQYGNAVGIVSSTSSIYANHRQLQMVLKNAISVIPIKKLLGEV